MQPPTTLAWPSMYLVVEWTTMSQPNSMGRQSTGVGKVLSMTRGTEWAWAMRANRSMSQTISAGLATVSPNTSRVRSSKRALISSSVASGVKKRASMPSRLSVKPKRLMVPP